MAALTDGTVAGTIPSSPVVPTDTTTPVPTTSTAEPAATPVAPSSPVTTVSSKAATDLINNKIVPTLNTASADITANNTKTASTTPDGYTPVYGTDGAITGYNSTKGGVTTFQPSGGTSTSTTGTKTTSTTPTANPGFKFAYDPITGAQSQIPVEDQAGTYGLVDNNPKAGPSTPTTGAEPVMDSQGNTYKSFTDGTYGKFDVSGNYVGAASSQEVQDAQHSHDLLNSLNQLANGTYPLTADQQAQVTGLQQQYAQLIEAQKTANANFTGGTTVAMNLYGIGNTLMGLGQIKGTVDAGIAKIADLNSKMTTAVAQMKSGFQTDNYNLIKGAYDTYNNAQKDRQAEIDKLTATAAAAAQQARDNKMKLDNYNLDVAKYKQTGDQNAFENALKTEQEAFDEKYKTKSLALEQFKAGMGAGGGNPGGITTSATITASGNPDPASQQAVIDQITQKYGPMTAVAIKGLANYEINPTDWRPGATKGMSREQAVALAKMYDPTYSDAQFPVRQAYIKSLASNQGGTIGSAINAANKSINHLTAYLSSASQLANGVSETVNSLLNPVRGLDPKTKQLISATDTEGMGVADELAKFFKGTGVTDVASIEAWRSKLSSNTSPGTQKGLAQGAITLLAGQLETLSEQYQATMGKAPDHNLLGASAMANLSRLKNEGYEVAIPGVLFTDKNAYVEYDANATANMATAVKQLTDAGLPVTPENILQLAQNQ